MIGFGAICRFSRVEAQITFTEKRRKQSSFNKRKNMTTLRSIKSMARSPSRFALVLISLVLACFTLPERVHAVSPAPDGGYPNGNTAEGQNALHSLTSGGYNTAIGFLSLHSDTQGSFNTAIGAATLLANTGDNNTATGGAALLNNTTGNNNNAYGVTALLSNTTGPYNNAFGNGALASNTTGDRNTAIGEGALLANTTGFQNLAIGVSALRNNATGHNNIAIGQDACSQSQGGQDNTAIGDGALQHNTSDGNTAIGSATLIANTSGGLNTAVGGTTMPLNTTGSSNTAIGLNALFSNVSGDNNTAIGRGALGGSIGSNNVALGNGAGSGVTTASNAICIGAAGNDVTNSCYIGQIFNASASGGSAVFIDANNKLGTVVSSKRFKEDIQAMSTASEALLTLKPVTFRYKKEIDPQGIPQFGLVAEDVAAVNPDLVVRDKEGKPYTVRYDQVNAMLLNEFLKEHKTVQEQGATIAELKKEIAALTAGLQKVSAQIEASEPAPQVVNNNQ